MRWLYFQLNRWYENRYPNELLLELLCQAIMRKDKSANRLQQYIATHHVNWREFLQLVQTNKLIGPVSIALSRLPRPSFIPTRILNELVQLQTFQALHLKYYFNNTSTVLRALVKAGVPFVIMKTYALRREIYPTIAVKPSFDIDLLVAKRYFPKAARCLTSLGYKFLSDHHQRRFTSRTAPERLKYPLSQEVFRRQMHSVEIHTAFADVFDFVKPAADGPALHSMTLILQRNTRRVPFGGLSVRCLAPTELFISLFLHAFLQHNFQDASSYWEIANVIRHDGEKIDWVRIRQFVRTFRVESYFFWFLGLLNTLYPTIIPRGVAHEITRFLQKLSLPQSLLFFHMRFKVFHPTLFWENIVREQEKEWTWAIIDRSVSLVVMRKIKRRIRLLLNISAAGQAT